jgi:hypothetical protein
MPCTLGPATFFGISVGVFSRTNGRLDHHRQAIPVRRANAYSAYLSFRIQKNNFDSGKCGGEKDRVEDHRRGRRSTAWRR